MRVTFSLFLSLCFPKSPFQSEIDKPLCQVCFPFPWTIQFSLSRSYPMSSWFILSFYIQYITFLSRSLPNSLPIPCPLGFSSASISAMAALSLFKPYTRPDDCMIFVISSCSGLTSVTSFNVDYVPQAYIFKDEDLHDQADGHFGLMDCFQWPQVYTRDYSHSVCIPWKDSLASHTIAWYMPTPDDFITPVGSSSIMGLLLESQVNLFDQLFSSYMANTTPSSTRKPLAKTGCIDRCDLQSMTSCTCGSTPLHSEILSFLLGSFSEPYWTFTWCSNSSKSSTHSWTPLRQNLLVKIPCGWGVSQWTQKSVRRCTLLGFLCGLFTTRNISLWQWISSNLCALHSLIILSELSIQKMGKRPHFAQYFMVQVAAFIMRIHADTMRAPLLMCPSQWQAHPLQILPRQTNHRLVVSSPVQSSPGLQGKRQPWAHWKVCILVLSSHHFSLL